MVNEARLFWRFVYKRKKKKKRLKIGDKESFYIHDTSILVVLNQEHEE